MDSREDEQLKGITMKSSAIALQHNQSEDVCFVLLKSTSFCLKKIFCHSPKLFSSTPFLNSSYLWL